MVVKKGTTRVSEDTVEELARVPLQAILLADSFAQKFRPITLERPKVFPSLCLSLQLHVIANSVSSMRIYIMFLQSIFEQRGNYCHDFIFGWRSGALMANFLRFNLFETSASCLFTECSNKYHHLDCETY